MAPVRTKEAMRCIVSVPSLSRIICLKKYHANIRAMRDAAGTIQNREVSIDIRLKFAIKIGKFLNE